MLLALAAFGKSAFSGIVDWLSRRSLAEIICICLAITLILTGYSRNHWKNVATTRQAQLSACQKGRAADRAAYVKAQNDAAAKNKSDIQRTEQRQKEISDARVADLNSRLERIARELRDNPSAKGSAGSTPIPETGPAPCRAIDPAWLCLSPADRLRAAQNEERQDELIDWVIGISKIDPNK
jgi:hypothetical protein